MAICNCHNCRFVLPKAIELVDRLQNQPITEFDVELYEEVEKFLAHVREGIT